MLEVAFVFLICVRAQKWWVLALAQYELMDLSWSGVGTYAYGDDDRRWCDTKPSPFTWSLARSHLWYHNQLVHQMRALLQPSGFRRLVVWGMRIGDTPWVHTLPTHW